GDEVRVRVVDDDLVGPGSRVGEAGLRLGGADLGVPGAAELARPAAAHERDRHTCAGAVAGDVGACTHDPAHELVARYVGDGDGGVVAGPRVPVGAAHAGGLDGDDDAVLRRGGGGDLLHGRGLAEGFVDDCAHGAES